ncbi:MAG: Bax inhibitor-1/YccA family protein [Chloroflexota bacterium]
MNNFDFDNNNSAQGIYATSKPKGASIDLNAIMRAVYMWMVAGLATSAVISFLVASNQGFVQAVAPFYLPIFFVQIAIVFGIGWAMQRVSPTVMGGLFFLYAALNGLVFGIIFFALVASGQSMAIAQAFITTAGLFGAMSIVGYTTNVDLSKFGSFFMMAIIGLLIAIVVNWFLGSSMLDLVISVAGVLIFTALTAYDTQRIKEMSIQMGGNMGDTMSQKVAIMGALTLYLDFINIFIFLLQLFAGGGRD